MDPFDQLLSPRGRTLLAEVGEIDDADLLATAERLRRDHPPELVSAALTQARLRRRARAKFGGDADLMYFTPDGLEQATRASVAAHRARRFHGRTVVDLCCGIGGDLVALARVAPGATGVDNDPARVAVARANVAALGLDAEVHEGDVTAWPPPPGAVVFADPARRGKKGRIFDPRDYAPPLGAILDLAAPAPGACVKVAPGIPYEAIPGGAEAEWVSDGREVKEAALWLGDLRAEPGRRRATVLPADATLVDDPNLGAPPVGPWRRYLYEPDGAIVRAHLVGELAARLDGALADPHIAYITSDRLVATPFATAYEIGEVVPFSVKRLRALLRERRVGTLTIKKRGSAVDVDRLHRDLRPSGDESAVLVVTRVESGPVALLCTRLVET